MSVLMIRATTAQGDIVQINLAHVVYVAFAGAGDGTRSTDGAADKVRMVTGEQIKLGPGEWSAALARLDADYDTGPLAERTEHRLYVGSTL